MTRTLTIPSAPRLLAIIGVTVALAATSMLLSPLNRTDDSVTAASRIDRAAFHDAMRELWEDHIVWTRMVIVGVVDDVPGTQDAVARLLANQDDIGDAIQPFYGAEAGEELSTLLREHITGAADLLAAAKAGSDTTAAAEAWYANADSIARFLSTANPDAWPLEEMKAMMRDHLDLTLDEALARFAGDYAADIAAYDAIHHQILHMADMLSDGIVAQFPTQFRGGTK